MRRNQDTEGEPHVTADQSTGSETGGCRAVQETIESGPTDSRSLIRATTTRRGGHLCEMELACRAAVTAGAHVLPKTKMFGVRPDGSGSRYYLVEHCRANAIAYGPHPIVSLQIVLPPSETLETVEPAEFAHMEYGEPARTTWLELNHRMRVLAACTLVQAEIGEERDYLAGAAGLAAMCAVAGIQPGVSCLAMDALAAFWPSADGEVLRDLSADAYSRFEGGEHLQGLSMLDAAGLSWEGGRFLQQVLRQNRLPPPIEREQRRAHNQLRSGARE